MHILIVDDEVVLLNSIKIVLQNLGYHVTTATSGEQALEYLVLHRGGSQTDLVVVDYLMPKMDGLELTKELRKSFPHLPVLIMTAYADTKLVIEALRNHCNGFIEKPFSPQQLVEEIDNLIRQHTPSRNDPTPHERR